MAAQKEPERSGKQKKRERRSGVVIRVILRLFGILGEFESLDLLEVLGLPAFVGLIDRGRVEERRSETEERHSLMRSVFTYPNVPIRALITPETVSILKTLKA